MQGYLHNRLDNGFSSTYLMFFTQQKWSLSHAHDMLIFLHLSLKLKSQSKNSDDKLRPKQVCHTPSYPVGYLDVGILQIS